MWLLLLLPNYERTYPYIYRIMIDGVVVIILIFVVRGTYNIWKTTIFFLLIIFVLHINRVVWSLA